MEESNKISTILQCFVDTNLELNENLPYAGIEVPAVFFTELFRTAPENTTVGIQVALSAPSEKGIEVVTVVFIPGTAGPEDISAELPVTLTWEPGEQFKTVQVELLKDFELEDESNEAFSLALVSALNCTLDEDNSVATTFIVDTTVFNRASFVETDDGQILSNGTEDFLSYNYDSSFPTTLRVGLNNPSEAGVERLNVKLYRLSTNYFDGRFAGEVFSIPVAFDVGEQFKDVVIENVADSILNISPILVAAIENPVKVTLDTGASAFEYALMYVTNNLLTINRRWTTMNFGEMYRQKGPVVGGYLQLRSPVSSEIPQTLSDTQNSWSIKYGNVYNDNTSSEANGYAEVNYSGFPLYRFGPAFGETEDDMILKVTNNGEYDILWDGGIVPPGNTFDIPITGNEFEISLPSNSNLIEAGEVIPQTGENAQERLYADSLYSMSLKYNSPGYTNPDGDQVYSHGFTLQGGSGGQISIGDFSLKNYGNIFESQINKDYLASYYVSASTRYNGSSCTNGFSGPENIYNIRMLGYILLDDTEPTTAYGGFEFIKLNDFSPVCGEGNTSYTSPLWMGIPFEVASPINKGGIGIGNEATEALETRSLVSSGGTSSGTSPYVFTKGRG